MSSAPIFAIVVPLLIGFRKAFDGWTLFPDAVFCFMAAVLSTFLTSVVVSLLGMLMLMLGHVEKAVCRGVSREMLGQILFGLWFCGGCS